MIYDFGIVGGGILGLSTAMTLTARFPGAGVLVLEKEASWARHQTGHNSGVIHSGIYYRPGSLKARLARTGNAELVDFCREHGIRHEICGKVIVATGPSELSRLEVLYERGRANGLCVRKIGPAELREMEPHAAGLAAIHVPSAGIVDFEEVTKRFAAIVAGRGADLRLGTEALELHEDADGVAISCARETFRVGLLINCAGLHSDRVARRMGLTPPARIVPFRGEYYELTPLKRALVRNLVYPVPDPRFPFLGVHLTRGIDGTVHAGPNAVLSLKREGYRKGQIDWRDAAETLTYSGMWRLAARNWRVGLGELQRSLSRTAFARSLQRLVPDVEPQDLVPGRAGVRAQALQRDGQLVDDFLFLSGPRSIHVCNAPSPAATACLPIGQMIVDRIREACPSLN